MLNLAGQLAVVDGDVALGTHGNIDDTVLHLVGRLSVQSRLGFRTFGTLHNELSLGRPGSHTKTPHLNTTTATVKNAPK